MDDYYLAFTRCQRSKNYDVTLFVEFVFKAFIATFYKLKDRMTSLIREFVMRNFIVFKRGNKQIAAKDSMTY